MVLEGRPGFVLLRPTHLKIFRVLSHLRDESLHNVEKLCIYNRLACCRCEVGALVESLNENFKWLLRIVSGMELLVVNRYVCGRDAGVMSVEMSDQLEGCLHGVSCVHVF